MRVLIATDSIGDLPSLQVGSLIGRAWQSAGAQVAVVPMATSGQELFAAIRVLGAIEEIVDLQADNSFDGSRPVVGVVAEDQLNRPLTGLLGVAAERGRRAQLSLSEVLAEDAKAAAWAAELWPSNPDAAKVPGGGAYDGAGLTVLAAGGRLTTGPALCAELAGLMDSARQADLIVTGCNVLDFGNFGGAVVAELIKIAGIYACPLIIFTQKNYISVRELRASGIESAHEINGDVATGLIRTASAIAKSWNW